MRIQTDAFQDKGTIPTKHCMPGAGGDNISIPLQWSDVPQRIKSFALSIIDPHPVANNWIHWLVINIPGDVRSLPENASGNAMPSGSMELSNSFGNKGYGGPQPPPGTGKHPYVVTIYALDIESLDLAQNVNLEVFVEAVKNHILDKAEITGVYEQ